MTITTTNLDLTAATRGPISRDDAEALTAAIRANANRLWMLVAYAHERKAWRAMGYDSWKDYVVAELRITEQRSYQLVDTGRVMLTIAEAAGVNAETLDPIPARTVAKVKSALPALRRAIRTAVREAASADDLVELEDLITAAVDEVRASLVDTRTVATRRTAEAISCPACAGSGYLGTGRKATELADRLTRWLARTR